MSKGETHTYEIALEAGHYLHVDVEQRGVDVILALIGPGGEKVAESISPDRAHGPEPISIISQTSGIYRLEVRSVMKDAPAGRYEISIKLRASEERDRTRIAAERSFMEGRVFSQKGTADSFKMAIVSYVDALRLYREVEDREKEAETLINLGYAHERLSDSSKASEYYHQGLAVARTFGFRLLEARLLNNLGAQYARRGEHQKAIDYYQQALHLSQAIGHLNSKTFALTNIGYSYKVMGDIDKALAAYNQTLSLRHATGDTQAVALAFRNLGVAYEQFGESQKALDHFMEALKVYRALRNRREELDTLTEMASLYLYLGDLQRAGAYYSRLLPLRRELGDSRGEARILTGLAEIFKTEGDNPKALEYLTRALGIRRRVSDLSGEISTLAMMGAVYTDLAQKDTALSSFEQALTLSRKLSEYREAYVLRRRGMLYARLAERGAARADFQRALEIFQAIGHRPMEAEALYHIAQLEREAGNLLEAREMLKPALRIADSLRTRINTDELRGLVSASVQDFYNLEIDLLMSLHQRDPAKNYHVAALETSERARARALIESLTEAGADIRQGVEPALLERERSTQRLLNAKADRLMRLLVGKPALKQAEKATEELEALRMEYQQVQAKIRATSPRYAALTQPELVSLREIQEELLAPDALMLEYRLGKERSYLWAVTQDDFHAFELPARAQIEAQARRFYDLLTAPGRRVKFETPEQRRERLGQADAQLLPTATDLSRMVLGPAAALLKGRRLLVIADGALHYVPFAALQSPDGPAAEYQPLSLDHEIVNLPSASALGVMRGEFAGRSPAPKMLAVLADPVFDPADERIKRQLSSGRSRSALRSSEENLPTEEPVLEDTLTRAAQDFALAEQGHRIPRLPFTRREAKSIATLAPVHQRKQLLDFEASRAAATSSELGQYRYIHFATHAFVNSVHPELSGVVLSLVDAQGRKQDGFLRAHEIFNLSLPAELIVLSGCQTGLGKEIKGEGFIGLTRGFMYAGAARVLVSLWDVHDEATSELMARFYKAMFSGQRLHPAAALRAAQIAMWKEKQWRSPYYWASFVLQGEPN